MTGGRLLWIALGLALVALGGGGAPALAAGPTITTSAERTVVTGGDSGESVWLSLDGAGRLTLTGLTLPLGAIPIGCDWDQCGPGDDTLRGMANPTYGGVTLDGGPGADRLDPVASSGALTGGDGADTVNGGPSHDLLDGGAGDDRLIGGGGDDVLDGGQGRDLLVGGAGAGNDEIDSLVDGADTIDCGPGRDTVRADRVDKLRNREIVRRS
jgi:Ca2+-binding RTX toxin-like protein